MSETRDDRRHDRAVRHPETDQARQTRLRVERGVGNGSHPGYADRQEDRRLMSPVGSPGSYRSGFGEGGLSAQANSDRDARSLWPRFHRTVSLVGKIFVEASNRHERYMRSIAGSRGSTGRLNCPCNASSKASRKCCTQRRNGRSRRVIIGGCDRTRFRSGRQRSPSCPWRGLRVRPVFFFNFGSVGNGVGRTCAS